MSAELSFCTSSAQDFYPLKVWNFFQSDRAQRRYSVRPRRRAIYFDAFRRSVHMHQYAEGFDRKRIDLKTHFKVDQNVNFIRILLVWTVENASLTENIAGACVFSMLIELNLRHIVQFYPERFSVSRKRIKRVVWTPIDRCVFDDNENALVLIGPKIYCTRAGMQI